jgi:peptide/nickel transport system permease protein
VTVNRGAVEAVPVFEQGRNIGYAAFLSRLFQRRLAVVGTVIILILVIVAAFAPLIAPYDPTEANLSREEVLRDPSWDHLFGTDALGRDVFSRVVYGSRVSLQVAVIAVGIAVAIGLPLGIIAGFVGGWLDNVVIMRIMDALMSLPALILMLVMAAALGPSLTNGMIVIGVVFSPGFARLVRGQVLSVREEPYVQAATCVGASLWRVMTVHVLPNVMNPVIVLVSLSTAGAILAEASLSFLGVGVQPPTPAWGSMLRSGYAYIETTPWISVAPGAAIMLVVLGFNFLGDALRDALDPRLRGVA